ncbi:hypothetical protein NX059_003972 [Plenodomus lindquistii]|nr:hypothetical protein NX059_003972 [Plenodomus lindquistii]
MLYQNNPLENCNINYVKIEMVKHTGRTAQQVAWQRWGPELVAAISCSVTTNQGSMRFNFTGDYNLIPPNANKGWGYSQYSRWEWAAEENVFQFVVSNNTEDPAMWWGESLMSYGWLEAALKMESANIDEDDGNRWQSGSITFWPSRNTSDISSSAFFNNRWYILKDSGQIYWDGEYGTRIDPTAKDALSQMLYSTDKLAKAFYSAISADIGIANDSNVLTNETALQEFTMSYKTAEFVLVSAGPADDSYDALKPRTGKPEITPSTIFTTYLCQTPVRKLATSLFVSVLLANLVLLRGLWTIVTLIAGYIVGARDSNANHCMRCIEYEPVVSKDVDGET